MFIVMRILLGLVVGCIGFVQIAENPVQGCSALLVGGFVILAGLDHLSDLNR
jgi:hypothetical protein